MLALYQVGGKEDKPQYCAAKNPPESLFRVFCFVKRIKKYPDSTYNDYAYYQLNHKRIIAQRFWEKEYHVVTDTTTLKDNRGCRER